jgi:hypothetical protein
MCELYSKPNLCRAKRYCATMRLSRFNTRTGAHRVDRIFTNLNRNWAKLVRNQGEAPAFDSPFQCQKPKLQEA